MVVVVECPTLQHIFDDSHGLLRVEWIAHISQCVRLTKHVLEPSRRDAICIWLQLNRDSTFFEKMWYECTQTLFLTFEIRKRVVTMCCKGAVRCCCGGTISQFRSHTDIIIDFCTSVGSKLFSTLKYGYQCIGKKASGVKIVFDDEWIRLVAEIWKLDVNTYFWCDRWKWHNCFEWEKLNFLDGNSWHVLPDNIWCYHHPSNQINIVSPFDVIAVSHIWWPTFAEK